MNEDFELEQGLEEDFENIIDDSDLDRGSERQVLDETGQPINPMQLDPNMVKEQIKDQGFYLMAL